MVSAFPAHPSIYFIRGQPLLTQAILQANDFSHPFTPSAPLVNKAGIAHRHLLTSTARRQHARRTGRQGLGGHSTGLDVELHDLGENLGDARRVVRVHEGDKHQPETGRQRQEDVVVEGHEETAEDHGYAREELAELFGDAELQVVGHRRDDGGRLAGGQHVERGDGQAEEGAQVDDADGGRDAQAGCAVAQLYVHVSKLFPSCMQMDIYRFVILAVVQMPYI